MPTIYTAQGPAELIQFKGQPDFVPIVGTQLLWASNTTNDVLIDTTNNDYYVLLAGRWFKSSGLTGPWTFVPSNALPPGFAQIPPASLAGAVLPSVAGTPQAQEAVIANTIPQTATVPLKNGPSIHAELRRSAAIFADSRYAADVRGEFVGTAHPGQPDQLLRRHGGSVVHGNAIDGAVDGCDVGARGDLQHSAVVTDLLRHICEDLRSHAQLRL